MTDKSNNLIEAAIKNGAGVSETLAGVPIKIVVDEAVLQATIDAVNARAEPIAYRYKDAMGHWRYVGNSPTLTHYPHMQLEAMYPHPPLSTGDYIKRSDLLKDLNDLSKVRKFDSTNNKLIQSNLGDYFYDTDVITAINNLPSVAVNKPDNEMQALLKKVVESQKNDTRSDDEIIAAGVDFIVNCPLGYDEPNNAHPIEEVSDALPIDWQPIETVPKDYITDILIGAYRDNKWVWIVSGGYDNHGNFFIGFTDEYRAKELMRYHCEPTHWMPLPNPTMQSQADKANEQAVNDAYEEAAQCVELSACLWSNLPLDKAQSFAKFLARQVRALINKG